MQTVQVSLPEALSQFVESQVSSGRYPTASEYLANLVQADEQRLARERLEAKLLAGVRSPSQEMMDSEWDDIRTKGLKVAAAAQKK